jgi:hypothetical protein
MPKFAFLSFAWKVVIIKAFRSVLYVLHRAFNDAFLIWGMDMVLQLWESACLWVPSSTASRNSVFPYALLKGMAENARLPQTCFFSWICLLGEFLC